MKNILRLNLKNLKLNTKLIVLILITSTIIFASAIAYITMTSRGIAMNYSKRVVQKVTKEYANKITSELNIDVGKCRALGKIMENYHHFDSAEARDKIFNKLLIKIIEENPQYVSVWLNWELSVIKKDYTKSYGRRRTTYFRLNNQIQRKQEFLNLQGDDPNSLYYELKTEKKEIVTDPYFDSYTKKKEDEVLVTSIAIPILTPEGEYAGVIGVDVLLERYQSMIVNLKPFKGSYAFMVANNGVFVAHAKGNLVGKSMFDFISDPGMKNEFQRKIEKGTDITYIREGKEEGKVYVSYAPVAIGGSPKPWSIALTVPINRIMEEASKSLFISVITGIIGLIILTIIIWVIANTISKPIKNTTKTLTQISENGVGEKTQYLPIKTKDEIGEMNRAVNNLVDSLKNTANFAKLIGEGKFDSAFKPLSSDDILGNSLIEMQNSLKKAKEEEEKRQKEDKKRYWVNNGLNKFSEILRKNHHNLNQLSFDVVLNIVKYLDAVQGGLFIVNNDENDHNYLELAACYAYDRQKFINKKVELGEGLIGTCYLEKKTIYLEEIPDDYINIASGLGKSKPRSLLIVPLILNEEIFGIVEIASLKKFEDYKIEFVKEVGESVASVVSSVKTNIRTAELLEQSQQQSEEMKAQEEEMRQNMEELHATQEEMGRKNAEIEGVMNGINDSLAILEFDMDEAIINANNNFYEITGLTYGDINNKKLINFIQSKYIEDGTYDELWRRLREGFTHSVMFEYKLPEKKLWTKETITPVKNASGNIYKAMSFIIDITEQKELEVANYEQIEESRQKEQELKEKMGELKKAQNEMKDQELEVHALSNALSLTAFVTEYNREGKIIGINDAYLDRIKASREEILGEHHSYKIEMDEEQQKIYDMFWNSLISGEVHENIVHKYYTNLDEPYWVNETYTPVMDHKGNVVKIVKIGFDITPRMIAEKKLKEMEEKLKDRG